MIPLRYIALAAFLGLAANAAPLQFQSSESQVALVELYTSEGCSSCPPAESWLSKLKGKSGLWSNFVPVAFHVDYWDYLGWRDKWSRKQYSDRQRRYAEAWGAENIYTPEFVLNGREWHDWFGLRGAPGVTETKTGILKVTSDDSNHWQVNFIPTIAGATSFEVHAALLLSGLGSDVREGENSGRHLQHDFVVSRLIHQSMVGKNAGFEGNFTMAPGPDSSEGRPALAVWVTLPGNLEPMQAVGGWLGQSENGR